MRYNAIEYSLISFNKYSISFLSFIVFSFYFDTFTGIRLKSLTSLTKERSSTFVGSAYADSLSTSNIRHALHDARLQKAAELA